MIRMEKVSKRFRTNDVLRDLTLEVPAGSVFALAGPNGAGKSTAIKIAMNLLRATSGRTEILGVDSRRLGPRELAQIGYASENQVLPEWMRVEKFLDYCRPFYPAWDGELAAQLMSQYGLPPHRRLRDLSRGMKIKAALAASLAYRPKLIVLDEPFSGLDVLVREELIESIVERTPEATVFLASHDLAEIESFATHVAYLNEGRLVFAEEITSLSGRFREVEVILDAPAELPGELPSNWLGTERAGVVVRFTDVQYDALRSREEVARRFRGVHDISTRQMSFRAIFLALAKARSASCA